MANGTAVITSQEVSREDQSTFFWFGKVARMVILSRGMQVTLDASVVTLTLFAAYLARFDDLAVAQWWGQFRTVLPFILGSYLLAGVVSRSYRMVWHLFNRSDAVLLVRAVAAASLLVLSADFWIAPHALGSRISLGILTIHPVLVFGGWVGLRLLRTVLYARTNASKTIPVCYPKEDKKLLVIGAGTAGLNLVQELKKRNAFRIVGFLDDDPKLQQRMVDGLPVMGRTTDLEEIAQSQGIKEVVLCIPSASVEDRRRIIALCEQAKLTVSSVPSLSEIMTGQVTVGSLRPVRTEALLERERVLYSEGADELTFTYSGKRILVTGAGGSIGSELARQLKEFDPASLILLDKDENGLFEIDFEIREGFNRTRSVVSDVREYSSLLRVFEKYRPQVVFHAAAYKHVPLMELHPHEAVRTNILGTKNVADLAARCGVETFVMISTDKAVNPSSVMGATKRTAEMTIQNMANSPGTQVRFCCVRFGNVLGSRGSVVPLFQRLIRQGKSLPITHPEMSRFFMTIPEAVHLVIRAGSLGRHGEVFLLDMGKPVKVLDLARNLIRLSGLIPDEDIKIRISGLRPGEKLHEELLVSGENGIRDTKYSKIFVAKALPVDSVALEKALNALLVASLVEDGAEIKRILSSLGIGYCCLDLESSHSNDSRELSMEAAERPGVGSV